MLFVLQAAIKRFVAQTNHTPKPFVWTQIPPLLVQRRHRHAGMDGGQDLALGRTVEPVAETAQAFEEPLPELDLVGDLGRMPERPRLAMCS